MMFFCLSVSSPSNVIDLYCNVCFVPILCYEHISKGADEFENGMGLNGCRFLGSYILLGISVSKLLIEMFTALHSN